MAKDFTDLIIKDLIAEGYEGDELVKELHIRKSQLQEAHDRYVAENRSNKVYKTVDELFDELNDEDEDNNSEDKR